MSFAARKRDEEERARQEHAAEVLRAREWLDDGGSRSRDRRCIVTGEIKPDRQMIRFVMGPDNGVVPDVAAKLPGRGIWVTAKRSAVNEAVKKGLFARAAKAPAIAAPDLADRTEKALVARMLGDLGLARRAGQLVLGFDNVQRALESPKPPGLLIEALEGAKDGKRKLYAAAHARGLKPDLAECLTQAELGLALGRENVIHAAVRSGGLAERLFLDAERLCGFRTRSGSERDS